MRLTLRTLLAYMDKVLTPEDQVALQQKIEKSEQANELIHRTKDAIRRLHLETPEIFDPGADANLIAEYLDNTIDPKLVTDFERICLESDIHLAEVGACHHIMSMVLNGPAEIDESSKERMYSIPDQVEETKEALAASALASQAHKEALTKAPSYLTEEAQSGFISRHKNIVVTLAAVFLFAVGWMITHPPIVPEGPAGEDIAQLEEGLDDLGPSLTSETSAASETSPNTADPTEDAPPFDPTSEAPKYDPNEAPPLFNPTPPALPKETLPPTETDKTETDKIKPDQPTTENLDTENANIENPKTNGVGPTKTDEATPGADNVQPDSESENTDSATSPIDPTEASTEETEDASPADTNPQDKASEDEKPPAPKAIQAAQYLGGNDVLLKYEASGVWFRSPAKELYIAGDQILSLPHQRSVIVWHNGIRITLSGGTLLRLSNDKENPLPELVYGRVLLLNPTTEEKIITIQIANLKNKITLSNNSLLAIEVQRKYIPGNDPRTEESPQDVKCYSIANGTIGWENEESSFVVNKPSSWQISENKTSAANPTDHLLSWLDKEEISNTEQRAIKSILKTLSYDRAMELQLLEHYSKGRRREDKALVALWGLYVGQYQPLVEALRDASQKNGWKSHIKNLRSAMALDPTAANKVFETLVNQRGDAAAQELFRMLCGYTRKELGETKEQIATGVLSDLIDYLEYPGLDFKVLSHHNLEELSRKPFSHNPIASSQLRKIAVRKLRKRLQEGELLKIEPKKGT